MKALKFLVIALIFVSCQQNAKNNKEDFSTSKIYPEITDISIVVLGNVQDAGSPHIACTKDCCKDLFENPDHSRKIASLGLIDPINKKHYLFEATPDLTFQMKMLKNMAKSEKETPDGIFVTHAHIGHYTGLMFFGKEAMNAKKIPVYAMPKMTTFLEENGPWSQLVNTHNIAIQELEKQDTVHLSNNLKVIPFLVPHRDEYSETAGFIIIGPNKKALFIPDIDKWDKWEIAIIEAIANVDYAFIDGTFFDGEELNNRDISTIPHPFIIESMEHFKDLADSEKKKIYFTHLNHTNPVLRLDSPQTKLVLKNGFNIARMHDIVKL